MAIDYSAIKNAFLNGMELCFGILFTDRIVFQFLDHEKSIPNDVYQEREETEKHYGEAIELIAKVNTTFAQGEQPIEGINIDAIITVPTKQLINNEIPRYLREDLDELQRGRFIYKDIYYHVDKVVPKTLVADEWQFYDFYCFVPERFSLTSLGNSEGEINNGEIEPYC